MKKEKTIISRKSVEIIAVAVVFTIVMTIVISANSDYLIAKYIPLLKKKAPAGQNQNQAPSFFKALFASNGQTEIYKIQKDDKWVVIVDGQESALYDSVANPTFSADGEQFAYSATIDGEEFVIMNNERQGKSYFDIRQILFNANGSILAYLADTGNGSLVVLNGVEGKLYQNIGTLETEWGTTFLAFTSNNQIIYRAVEGQKTFIVVDTAEGKKYAEIKEIYFSADGTQIAYYAQDGNNMITIINGRVTAVEPITPATPNNNSITPPATAPIPPSNTTPDSSFPVTSSEKNLRAKDSSRNLSPNIDNQPTKLNPLICGQTTECNF